MNRKWALRLLLAVTLLRVSSDPVSVSVRVGDFVTLPCDGSAYRGTPIEQLYIKWQTVDQDVCEFSGSRLYPGPGFENRTEFPLERIRQGDFSLTFQHTLFTDEEIYECLCEGDANQAVHLGKVDLTITGREESSSLSYGQPLTLRLYSRAAVTVWFNPAGAGASLPVCAVEGGTVTPDPAYGSRVSGQEQEVTLSALTFTDQGSYTVLDSQSRTISTVNVTVTGLVIGLVIVLLVLLVLGAAGCYWRRRRKREFHSVSSDPPTAEQNDMAELDRKEGSGHTESALSGQG
ncbi:uncharacterized protein LOC136711099 isoform X2 [Amia ocellicauda]|uniref:uncharacterized protein LOC136711099 isoform X2 n=1 Tax=Amia ocellicauda TaxID=2972642 RepID=UPI003464B9BA